MDAHLLNTIANFIWGIADDCLRSGGRFIGLFFDACYPGLFLQLFGVVNRKDDKCGAVFACIAVGPHRCEGDIGEADLSFIIAGKGK